MAAIQPSSPQSVCEKKGAERALFSPLLYQYIYIEKGGIEEQHMCVYMFTKPSLKEVSDFQERERRKDLLHKNGAHLAQISPRSLSP